MKKLLSLILVVIAVFAYQQFYVVEVRTENVHSVDSRTDNSSDNWRSGQQVRGKGVVVRLLSDDNQGSRHQRFIVRLKTGRTILIAHNIDIADRISSIRKGDSVTFYGEFEPNDRGGVIHWTHHDPRGRHESGWLKHNGKTYQ